MTQKSLVFDLPEGERRKEHGIDLAISKRSADLKMARDIARQLARRIPDGITADDVQQALAILGYELLGNAAGGIFRGREWVFTGRWRKSARVTNHGHQNRVWRLA